MKLIKLIAFVICFVVSSVTGQSTKLCVCFTGQGVNIVGVARDFVNYSDQSKQVLETSNNICRFDIGNMILGESSCDFSETDRAQIGLVTTQLAIWEGIKEKFPNIANKVEFFLGQSLGNYSAIYASGCISLDDILFLVNERGICTKKYIGETFPSQKFSMVAINNIEEEKLQNLIGKRPLYIAGKNTKQFFTVVGEENNIEEFSNDLKKIHSVTFSKIPGVKMPFHSRYMEGLKAYLCEAFANVHLKNPDVKYRYISDASGNVCNDRESIKNLLLGKQLVGPMKWSDGVCKTLEEEKITCILIIGDGQRLQKMIQENNPNIRVLVVKTPKDAEEASQIVESME